MRKAYATWAQNLSIAESKVFIEKKIKESDAGTEFTLAIKERKHLSVVGLIILKELNYEKGVGELAYCIDVKHQGKSWTTKGVKYMCNYAFEELKLDRLRILVHNSNIGSLKVAKKCGFNWKMTLTQEYTPPNSLPLDMEVYELIKG
jgi:ribosomal-protein-alanine N-acetyltransferase